MTMVRIRKQDIQPAVWIRTDQVDYCLECWKTWMAADSDRDLGIRTLHGLRGLSDTYGCDPEEAQQARDERFAAATDAMIDSLSRLHVWAIYKAYGIGQVWQFPHADLDLTLAQARAALERKLRKNICTAILF